MTRKRMGNPFHGVMDMITEMNRISETMSSSEISHAGERERGFADAWSPPTDILARGDDLVIRCEIPGVYQEDVVVCLSQNVLTISGQRRRDEDDVVYYSSERYMGAFRRDITLPGNVEDEDVEADYGEGLLKITVHGAANAAAPTPIEIRRRGRR